MSYIVNELTCKHCGHVHRNKNGMFLMSFMAGHDSKCFDKQWSCEKCGQDNFVRIHSGWLPYPFCCKESGLEEEND